MTLPSSKNAFEYENNFYLSCHPGRIGKWIAHYELFKRASRREGALVECGVFKGLSFLRFALFRECLGDTHKTLIGFDTFGKFPGAHFPEDKPVLEAFFKDAGDRSISRKDLLAVLIRANLNRNIELVAGDIVKTVPEYVKKRPDLRLSLLNLDVDLYEPSVVILEWLYPRLVKGGILLIDDYNGFPGETKAVDEFFRGTKVTLRRFKNLETFRFVVKP